MLEIIFYIEETQEGVFAARALGFDIFSEANSVKELENELRDAVKCHFEPEKMPSVIRMHFVKEEVIAV